jgi:hypothetical protein
VTSTCPAGHSSESDDYCDVCGAPIGASVPGVPSTGTPSAAGGVAPGAGPSGAPSPGSPGLPGSGSLLDLGPAGAGAGGDAGPACPNCGTVSVPGALFCEDCGYDFTTGQLPRPAPSPPLPPSGTGAPAGLATSSAADAGLVPPPLPSDLPGAAPSTRPGQGPVEWVAEVWIDPDWHAAQEVGEPCPSPGMPEVVPLRGANQLVGRRSVSRNIHPQIDCGADTGVSRRHAQLTTDGQRWWVEDLQSSNGTYVGTSGSPLPDTPVPPGQRTELPDDARLYVGAWTRIVARPATAEERAAFG